MASFLTTMFVSLLSSPGVSPVLARPLSPHCTLKQSPCRLTFGSYTLHHPNGVEEDSPYSPCAGRAWELLSEELRYAQTPTNPKHKQQHPFAEKKQEADTEENSNARTRGQFRPQRANKGTTSYQLRQFAEATLGSGSLRKAVKLPEGEDLNEWLAVNGTKHLHEL